MRVLYVTLIASLTSTEFGLACEGGQTRCGCSIGIPYECNPRSAEFAWATARLDRQRSSGLTIFFRAWRLIALGCERTSTGHFGACDF